MGRKAAKKGTNRRHRGGRAPILSEDAQRDIVAVILLVLSLLTVVALLFPAGDLGLWWRDLIQAAFGWGWPLVVAGVAAVAIYWLRQRFDEEFTFPALSALGAALLLLAILGLLHVVATLSGDPQLPPANAGGGGRVGYVVAAIIIRYLGRVAAFGLLLALAAVGGILAFGISLREIWETGLDLRASASDFYHRSLSPRLNEPVIRQNGKTVGPRPALEPPKPAPRPSPPGIAPVTKTQPITQPTLLPPITTPPVGTQPTPSAIRREWQLPSLDYLEITTEQELSQADIRRRVKIIEETLANFHIQARVVEVNQGPTVTQFGVQPAPGVSVSRIVARQNDLALALAASPIRIEAPVPGRNVVGIEVPNSSIALVGLRSVIETTAFQKLHAKSKLAIALGQDVSGGPIVADLGKMPHLLIAGATGSGKSVCINSLIACMLLHNTPDDMKLVMVDPKMVELVAFNGIPHLISPVITEVDKVINVLKWTAREMERRYKIFSASGARNIDAYNKTVTPRSGREYLPYILIVIDELADIMMLSPDEVERLLCRLAQMSRATGIHLIIATQRPSVDVITGLIKANFPARISFAVTSQVDSRVVLDMPGAEKLLGRGDMLYMASDSSSAVRLQGVFVSDQEIEAIVNFWRSQEPVAPAVMDITSAAAAPWQEQEAETPEDPLLEEAKRVVQQAGHASVSLLQRKLRIGYARAARLIDIMESQGWVSGPVDGGRTREVFLDEDGQGPRTKDE